ncbi:hypothetical protein [Luteolibacter sp. LG18]|uniref:hypothetical protein n=1 Tax=Luteolibacter sp. LG18 TaxID=2819286 RepID=UPI002B295FE6|nr:hypothetical protein llg_40360 [Luteolibacter sp. LG18]
MSRNWIRKAHRWLGLAFSLTAMMSAGSGVLHTVMTRTQAPPPSARPSGGGLDAGAVRISIAEAVAKLPSERKPVAVNVRMIGGEPWYQVFTGPGVPAYVSAVDGHVDPAQDERYAGEIAAGFLGGKDVKKTDYLTAFNNEYINIFRILPVHRFDAEDGRGTRVYVSTTTGSVTRHTDDQRQFEASAFTNFHKLGFIPNKDVRDWVQVITTGGLFLLSVFGVVLFFVTRPRRKGSM